MSVKQTLESESVESAKTEESLKVTLEFSKEGARWLDLMSRWFQSGSIERYVKNLVENEIKNCGDSLSEDLGEIGASTRLFAGDPKLPREEPSMLLEAKFFNSEDLVFPGAYAEAQVISCTKYKEVYYFLVSNPNVIDDLDPVEVQYDPKTKDIYCAFGKCEDRRNCAHVKLVKEWIEEAKKRKKIREVQ